MTYSRTFVSRILSCCMMLGMLWHVSASQTQSLSQAALPSAASLQANHAADLAAARQNSLDAQLRVAKAFNEGIVANGTTVVRRNYTKSLQWLQAASGQGSVEANAWIGSLYLFGHGVPQDLVKASSLIQSAAASHDPVGERFAGLIYETGQGVTRSYPKAVVYYSRASRSKDANAADRLGMLYLRGLGVKRDPAKAFALFAQGAVLGDSWAELNLGEMYYGGHVPEGAAQILQTAIASSGSVIANPPAIAPRSGQKAVPDYASALKFYSLSAAQGNRVAAYRLGRMYAGGIGVSQDYSQGFDYFKQSARRRYAPALLALGQAHESGQGTAVNLLHAYIAYNLAVEENDPAAPALLRSLVRKLSPTQLQQAQASLAEYKRQVAQANSD